MKDQLSQIVDIWLEMYVTPRLRVNLSDEKVEALKDTLYIAALHYKLDSETNKRKWGVNYARRSTRHIPIRTK